MSAHKLKKDQLTLKVFMTIV